MGEAKKIVLKQFQSAPAEFGFRMPAKWERHEATSASSGLTQQQPPARTEPPSRRRKERSRLFCRGRLKQQSSAIT